VVAKELQLLGAGGAKAANRPRCITGGAGERVGGIESCDDLEDRSAVIAAERKFHTRLHTIGLSAGAELTHVARGRPIRVASLGVCGVWYPTASAPRAT
jgi:hypothetical protein